MEDVSLNPLRQLACSPPEGEREYLALVRRHLPAAVWSRIRAGNMLTDEHCHALDALDLIEALRREARPSDERVLRQLIQIGSNAQRELLYWLVKRIESEMQAFFVDRWRDARTGETERYDLLWPLLDDPELPDELQTDVHAFVSGHLAEMIGRIASTMRSAIHEFCRDRLTDPRFPRSKDWLYLALLRGVPPEAARPILELHRDREDLSGEVARLALTAPQVEPTEREPRVRVGAENGFLVEDLVALIREDADRRWAFDRDLMALAAHGVWNCFKAGRELSLEECEAMLSEDALETVHSAAEPGYARLIQEKIKSGTPAERELAYCLAKPISTMLFPFFRNRWRDEIDDEERVDLVWRYLDDPTLPREDHDAVYEFVRSKHEIFVTHTSRFVKAPYPEFVLRKLTDPRSPRSKDWLYLELLPAEAWPTFEEHFEGRGPQPLGGGVRPPQRHPV